MIVYIHGESENEDAIKEILEGRKIDKRTIVFREKKLLDFCRVMLHKNYGKILYVLSDGT